MMGLALSFTPSVDAHPGKLDKNGGHTCRTNGAKWGLKDGEYHYHNPDGSIKRVSTNSSSKQKPAASQKRSPAVKDVSVYINGKKQTFHQNAYIKNGTTLVPMRGIFESLGASVHWDKTTKKGTGKKGNTTISLHVGNKKAYISENGVTKSVVLSHPAEIKNGSTMVPLRFISESLGATVVWDQKNNAVKINN